MNNSPAPEDALPEELEGFEIDAKPGKPPTIRGSDFAMRYEQGRWSEERILESINASQNWRAIAYGRSGLGPDKKEDIIKYFHEYKKLEKFGKRPDILVLRRSDYERLESQIPEDTSLTTDEDLKAFLDVSVCGIEAENSLWVTNDMPDYGKIKITKMKFIAPTIIVKREDESRLLRWQNHFKIPVCVVQVFYDRAFIATLDSIVEGARKVQSLIDDKDDLKNESDVNVESKEIEDVEIQARKEEAEQLLKKKRAREKKKRINDLQKELGVFVEEYSYNDSRSNKTTKKIIYRAHYLKTIPFGVISTEDKLELQSKIITEPNGKIIPYVVFRGGRLDLSNDALNFFEHLALQRESQSVG